MTRPKLNDVTLIDCGGPRQRSRSVSWSSNGSWLAWASTDRLAKIWSVEGGSAREVLAVSGHTGPIDRVRFHPKDATMFCSAAQDHTVRVWDVRSGSQRSLGIIGLQSSSRYGSCPASVEWSSNHLLVVAERNDTIHVYDVRKLNNSSTSAAATTTTTLQQQSLSLRGRATPYQSYNLQPNVVEGCQFSPNGDYLVATTTLRGEGMGELRIWKDGTNLDQPEPKERNDGVVFTYPGHTGPIYQFCFSPDGKRLATGGSDAIVGLWDVESMVCTNAITRRTKFIRSVSFSYDSKLVASSSEDDGIDLADASDGELIGTVGLAAPSSSSLLSRRGGGGADEIAFHPNDQYLLACARGDFLGISAPVAIAKLNMSQ